MLLLDDAYKQVWRRVTALAAKDDGHIDDYYITHLMALSSSTHRRGISMPFIVRTLINTALFMVILVGTPEEIEACADDLDAATRTARDASANQIRQS